MDNNYNGFNPNCGDMQQNGQQFQQAPMQQPMEQNAFDNAQQTQFAQQQYAAPAPVANDFVNQIAQGSQPSYDGDGTVAVAKKKSKVPFVIGGALVGVAGVGALLYAFVAPVKNWVKLTFMKPEKYFASVEEQAFSEYSATLSEEYGQVIEMIGAEGGTSADMGVEVIFGEKFMEILKEENPDMPDFTLESFGMDASSNSNENQSDVSASVTLNGESVLSLNIAMDMAEQMVYAQVPELSESYLTASLEEMISATGEDVSLDEMPEIDTDSLISEEDLKRIVEDYANIVYSSIETVEIAKGEDVEVAGKDYSFNIMEYELTEEEILDIVLEVLETAKDDEALEDMFTEFGVEYGDVVDGLIADVEAEAEDTSDDNYIVGRVYVDARGVIMGREYTIYTDDEETDAIYYIIGADGDDICFEAAITTDGEEVMTVEFSRIGEDFEGSVVAEDEEIITIEGSYEDEAYTGSISLTNFDEEEDLVVDFDSLKIVDEEMGYVSGTITIENQPAVDFSDLEEYGVEKLEVVLESDGKGQDVTLAFGDFMSLKVSAATGKGGEVDMPSDDADTYDMTTEMEAYLETVDYEPVATKIIELLGLEGEVTAEDIIAALESSMNSGGEIYSEIDEYGNEYVYDADGNLIDIIYADDYDDDDDDNYVDEEYQYDYEYVDFSGTTVNVFGTDYAWPCKVEPFCAYFGLDASQTLTAGDWDWEYNEYDSEVDFENPYAEDKRVGDCYVEYVVVSGDDSGFLITVNGIGIGASVADINDAFGTSFEMVNGEIEIEDEYTWDGVTFEVEDGAVIEFTLNADSDSYDLGDSEGEGTGTGTVIDDESSDDETGDDVTSDIEETESIELDRDYSFITLYGETVNAGSPLVFPAITEFDGMAGTSVEPGDYEINNSWDYSIEWENTGDTAVLCEECPVSSFVIFSDSGVDCSIDGVTFGMTIAEAEEALGTTIGATSDDAFVVFYSTDYSYIYGFSFVDGVVDEIAYSGY